MDSRFGADAGTDSDSDSDADADADADTDADAGGIPDEACADDRTADRATCETAWIVGRAALIADIDGETYGSGDDAACGSAEGTGLDQFYRIYLLKGETVEATMTDPSWEIDPVLALFAPAAGGIEASCGAALECVDDVTYGSESFSHTAGSSGWYTIAADSNQDYPELAYDGYVLRISIDCAGTCGC